MYVYAYMYENLSLRVVKWKKM